MQTCIANIFVNCLLNLISITLLYRKKPSMKYLHSLHSLMFHFKFITNKNSLQIKILYVSMVNYIKIQLLLFTVLHFNQIQAEDQKAIMQLKLNCQLKVRICSLYACSLVHIFTPRNFLYLITSHFPLCFRGINCLH